MASHVDRLRSLENIEKDIAAALDSAAQVTAELGKDKPNKTAAETHTQSFLKTVSGIESSLMKQLNYLSQVVTTHPHTGSSYGSQKDYQLSMQRQEHISSKLEDLERLKGEQQAAYRQSELRRVLSHQSSFPPIGTSSSSGGAISSANQTGPVLG